ncbi:MAG: hypothetical protein A2987_05230 [Omnitrophica bacterium RIFCSPLOWO2_01_FULL_45_10]|nr:MAG: hypothetical protein A2987_05230 [Omnitrophica bacterium RIFCSPLOWO2_01_FULL_45_10]
MKVLGISGSPKRRGNVEALLDKALEGAESEGAKGSKIILNELNFKPCQECVGCEEIGECVIEDDMQTVYDEIENADAVIIATPIFFGSLSAQVKMMVDRFQCLWVQKYVLKRALTRPRRKGALLCVSGKKNKDFFENAKAIIKIFFTTLDIDYTNELFFTSLDKSALNTRNEALKKAFTLGRSLASS